MSNIKNITTAAILAASLTTTVQASEAILNVEGEIQINGTTVINSDGSFNTDNQTQIDLSNFARTPGEYRFEYQSNGETCEIFDTVNQNGTTKTTTSVDSCSNYESYTETENTETNEVIRTTNYSSTSTVTGGTIYSSYTVGTPKIINYEKEESLYGEVTNSSSFVNIVTTTDTFTTDKIEHLGQLKCVALTVTDFTNLHCEGLGNVTARSKTLISYTHY